MKKNIFKIGFFALATAFALVACEDEVLVETEDTTEADALVAEIDNASNQYVTLDLENGNLTIANERLEEVLDSLWEVRNNLNSPYSQPTEVHLTVNVLSSAGTIFSGRSAGVSDATVEVVQNGFIATADPSSAHGLYLFKGLREGSASVRVSKADHTTVEFTIQLYRYFGQDVAEATSYNAAVQAVIYPVAGKDAGRITGKALANTSTLNDTTGYRFGTIAAFGAKAGQFISSPGNWNFTNYTQWSTYENRETIYGMPLGRNIEWENALDGHKIYAIPYLSNTYINNDYGQNGYITSITYKGLITSATIQNGSYTLVVPASNTYYENGLFNGVEITSEAMVTSHTRLTGYNPNYAGEEVEAGSTTADFTYFNRNNGNVIVYTGSGTTQVTLVPGQKTTVSRRIITENYAYKLYIPNEKSGSSSDIFVNTDFDAAFPEAGETKYRNIYFFPDSK